MATPNNLNNDAAPLRRNPVGSPADGKKMPGSVSSDSINSGMSLGSDVTISVKQTDYKNLVSGADYRAPAAPAVIPNQPGPRDQVGQFPLSARTPAGEKPKSFLGAESTDQN